MDIFIHNSVTATIIQNKINTVDDNMKVFHACSKNKYSTFPTEY